MTLSEETKESLSALPLLDAAYRLWIERYRLDREEAPIQPRPSAGVISPPDDVVIRKAIQNVVPERTTAPEGKMLARLKAIHPESNNDDLKSAIKRAVKFDSDCAINFSYRSPNYFDDCKRAIELSRIENPGFSDETYRHAERHLMFVMR